MTLSNVKYTKKYVFFVVENQMETRCECDDENPPSHSEDRQPYILQKKLK